MNRKIGSRIVSLFMAVVLCSVLFFDGTVKAALQEEGYEVESEYQSESGESSESVSQNAISEEDEEVLEDEENKENEDNENNEADLVYYNTSQEPEYAYRAYTASNQYSYLDSLNGIRADIHEGYYINNTADILENANNELLNYLISSLKDEGTEAFLDLMRNDKFNLVNDITSVFGDAWAIYEDCNKLYNINTESLHEHSSMKAIQAGLYTADMVLAAISIGTAVAGCTVGAPVTIALLIAGGVISIAASIVDSAGFANIMNNMDDEYLRFFDNLIDSIFMDTKTASGIRCYKPNIYIYGAKGKRITVQFVQPELLIKTEPYYNSETGWIVDVGEDGTLTDLQSNEYGFLFYESMTEKRMFDTTEGFEISAENRVKEFENILSDMGFNESEIYDFIEFWNVKLDYSKDYIMYPQYTDVVDRAMPVVISPIPDRIIRIWFVFEENQGQSFRMAEAKPMQRKGYTVVEWGGMVY